MNIVKIPLSHLYRLLLLFRAALYKYKLIKTHQFSVPIVSVGNIVFGGSGKTPFINWIYKELSGSYNVCIITRGYGRKNNNTIVIDSHTGGHSVSDVGDEPMMLINKNKNIQMVVGKDKAKSIQVSIKRFSPDIILLDDGFQSKYINRNLDIVMINGSMKKSCYHLFPFGVLREPINSLKRADFIVWTRKKNVDSENLFCKYKNKILAVNEKYQLLNEQNEYLSIDKTIRVVAVCGIGHPNSFIDTLNSFKIDVVGKYIVSDHFNYKTENMREIYLIASTKNATHIITTEKDYFKLKQLNKKNIPIIILEMDFHMKDDLILKTVKNLIKNSIDSEK